MAFWAGHVTSFTWDVTSLFELQALNMTLPGIFVECFSLNYTADTVITIWRYPVVERSSLTGRAAGIMVGVFKVCRFLILYGLVSRLNGILDLATRSFPSCVTSANIYGYRETIEALFVIGSFARMQVPFI